jgi:hypothetical protein
MRKATTGSHHDRRRRANQARWADRLLSVPTKPKTSWWRQLLEKVVPKSEARPIPTDRREWRG